VAGRGDPVMTRLSAGSATGVRPPVALVCLRERGLVRPAVALVCLREQEAGSA
jgi:hypothetical protein